MKKADQLTKITEDHSDKNIQHWTAFLTEGYSDEVVRLIHAALEKVIAVQSIQHPMPNGLDVAQILKSIHVDGETVIAALLSDPRLLDVESKDLTEQFGEKIAMLTENTIRLNHFHDYSEAVLDKPEQAETLRRMLLAMVQDVRAVIIRLAFRIQRLRDIATESYEIRHYIARETIDIYAPLANRMGIAQFKWELEDLAFRYLDPQAYKHIAKKLAENRVGREAYLKDYIQLLRSNLESSKIQADVSGRPKHIYSIWRKIQQKNLNFDELYDLRAVRIVTDKLASCYEILGLVHSLWQYLPREFDDYIANPKGNGYQSLHTVIVGPGGATVEVQIRTKEMHQYAEMGVAAHWRYKEGSQRDAAVEKAIQSIRTILENKSDDDGLFADFQTALYADRIFVLTPKGEIKDLIKGATPLDFAYAIHTEVGHRCRGAKVDGKIVPLTYQLKSGQRVEILTTKEGGPNRGWMDPNLGYLKSGHSINKVKAWYRQLHHEQNLADGKTLLEKERQRLGLEKIDLKMITNHFHLNRSDDFLIRLGRGDISQMQLASVLEIDKPVKPVPKNKPIHKEAEDSGEIKVKGVGNIMTQFARCCKPVSGDDIVGYITVGKGITIHRQTCKNMLKLNDDHKGRLIEVSWGAEQQSFATRIEIQAFDRQGLLRDITQIMSNAKANILEMNTQSDRESYTVKMLLTIEVRDTAHLTHLLDKLTQVSNISSAKRISQS